MRDIDGAAHQTVLDSALDLLVCRRSALKVLRESGDTPDACIVAKGGDLARWTIEQSRSWRSLLSTRPTTTAAQLSRSMPNNRMVVDAGCRMRSVFDHRGTEAGAREILEAEPRGSVYYYGWAPIQLRIVDDSAVLMTGPTGTRSILRMSSHSALLAARSHWEAVMAHAWPCEPRAETHGEISTRQLMVMELLRQGCADATVASTLGVSLRTVRSEVATLMRRYDAPSRFALGCAAAATLGPRR